MKTSAKALSRRTALFVGTILATTTGALTAHAQASSNPPPQSPTTSVEEIVVTANRRTQSVVDIPYNISVVSGDQIARSGATDLASLSQQIPNFTLQDRGPGFATSTVPIIRGLNASAPVQDYIPTAQSPVGFYIGNAPMFGYMPLDDVSRIEVLRGPQGTLYGAGSLGGTVRIIPNSPVLGESSGRFSVTGGMVAHSSKADGAASLLVNIPLSDDLAIRASYNYRYDAGFIDQFGIIARAGGNALNGLPILSNPSDVANSTAVHFNKSDVNYTEVESGRVALLWQPTAKLKVELAYNDAHVNGDATNEDDPSYRGGVDPIDQRTVFPAAGDYRVVLTSLQPYERTTQLSSADLSYDLDFGTLSSTTSYYQTRGAGVIDSTNNVFTNANLAFALGSPFNPRFVYNLTYPDFDRSLTEELRLVSKSEGLFDYVVGAFYQRELRGVDWASYAPGEDTQQAASGSSFPSGANGLTFTLRQRQTYEDKSVFGELTWNVTPRLAITGGARFFWEDFEQSTANHAILYDVGSSGTAQSDVHNHITKLNATYDYTDNQRIYATYSEGFRRGGANAFPTSGIFGEPSTILEYAPDTTKNYEVGFKGRLPMSTTYTIDAFYIDWQNPQIETTTPFNGWPVVINGKQARSVGAEFEVSGALFVPQLTYSVGFAYADASLTKTFCLPAGTFTGDVVACAIQGFAGDRLPGAPKTSGSVTFNYTQPLRGGASLVYSLNANYKGDVVNALPSAGITPATLPDYTLVNSSVTFIRKPWQVMAYVKNLFDQRVVLDAPTRSYTIVGALANLYSIGRPLEAGVRLTYAW